MKFISRVGLLTLLVAGVTGCAHVMVRQVTGTIAQLPDPQPRIALVGFSTYSSRVEGYEWGPIYSTTTYGARVSEEGDLKSDCSIGRPVETFPADSTKPVSANQAQAFVLRRQVLVSAYGFDQEIGEILVPGESSSGNPVDHFKNEMWNRDVDYYVVGSFSPAFFTSEVNGALNFLSVLLSTSSLFTIPTYLAGDATSTFDVYDSDLELLRTFTYEDRFRAIVAWWMLPTQRDAHGLSLFAIPKMTPPMVWKPGIERFEHDFIAWLRADEGGARSLSPGQEE